MHNNFNVKRKKFTSYDIIFFKAYFKQLIQKIYYISCLNMC